MACTQSSKRQTALYNQVLRRSSVFAILEHISLTEMIMADGSGSGKAVAAVGAAAVAAFAAKDLGPLLLDAGKVAPKIVAEAPLLPKAGVVLGADPTWSAAGRNLRLDLDLAPDAQAPQIGLPSNIDQPAILPRGGILANSLVPNDPSVSKATSLWLSAEPQMLSQLASAGPMLTRDQAEIIIQSEIAKIVQTAANTPNSGITFEVLSGKLTIESSVTIGGVKIAGGDLNVYKVSGMLAGSVVACNAAATQFDTCVNAALKGIGNLVAKEMTVDTADKSNN
jgi:hypothetical protein